MPMEFDAPLTPDDLPAGVYLAAFIDAERDSYRKQQPKIRLDYEVINPAADYHGVVVPLYCTGELNRNRRPPKRSKYYRLWTFANGGPPRHGQKMTTKVFEGYWRVRIKWSVSDGKEWAASGGKAGLPKGEPIDPVIEELLEREAGGQ